MAAVDLNATDVLRLGLSALLVDLERFLSVHGSEDGASDREAMAASFIATAKKKIWEEASPKPAARAIGQALCVLIPMGYRPPRWQDDEAEPPAARVVFPSFGRRRPGEWRDVPTDDAEVIALGSQMPDTPDP